jgi:hypothetical protein
MKRHLLVHVKEINNCPSYFGGVAFLVAIDIFKVNMSLKNI